MKENLALVKTILKEQSSMRIVLNGGKYELEDSTIPFQIGFDLSIAEQKPTHILVVDVTEEYIIDSACKDNCQSDYKSERTIFKLEPIHYLQLKRPGVHHLIFILFNEMNRKSEKFYLEKKHYGYENDIYFNTIEGIRLDNQISYAEAVVDVPKEFFADEPETKFQKVIYSWVNNWYRFGPIDECEYRKRKIFAFTGKPLLWLFGLIPRIMSSVFLQAFFFVIKTIAFFFGVQSVSFLPNKKKIWIDFLLKYPILGYKDVFKGDFWFGKSTGGKDDINDYGFKTLAVWKWRFYTPLTLCGISFYSACIYYYFCSVYKLFTSSVEGHAAILLLTASTVVAVMTLFLVMVTLPSWKKGKEWENKWNVDQKEGKKKTSKTASRIFFPMIIVLFFAFITPYISWNDFSQFIASSFKIIVIMVIILVIYSFSLKIIAPVISKKIDKIKEKNAILRANLPKETKVDREEIRKLEWLKKSFDIEKLPERVRFKTAPTSSSVLHEFTIGFWRLKAKVCKPYAKK